MSLRHFHGNSMQDHETMHAHYQSSKAKYRPGKRPPPTLLARAASLISLPSPPAEGTTNSSDVEMQDTEDEDEDEEEVDQLASEDEEEGHGGKAKGSRRQPCLLGSPANFLGAPAGTTVSASRKQLLNPFLHPALAGETSSSSSSSLRPFPGAPLSPSSSPVRPERHNLSPSRRRNRSDPDRIKLSSDAAAATMATTPPSCKIEVVDELEERRRAMGWYDEDNPFVDRNDDMARRLQQNSKEPLRRPETVTWVKRGQRVATTIPFSALLTSDSPSDDPFTFTAPKLLFPPPAAPQTPPSPTPAALPATPARQSKFLEALKAAGTAGTRAEQQQLPPTPATLKRRAGSSATEGGSNYDGVAKEGSAGPNKRLRTSSGHVDTLQHVGVGHRGLR
ncbi:hypothetical protein JCM10908_003387 [Rhodotorula pacifica]|uniref:uncharacterized protein n=1 Tax=Rhodotorula pacifica TaxID=1495444 RepID=UPI00318176DF